MSRFQRPPRLSTGLFSAFILLSLIVFFGAATIWDDATLSWAGQIRTPFLTEVMLMITFLGDGWVEVPMVFLAIYLLWRMGRPVCARRLFLAVFSGQALLMIAKASFQRPRPTIIDHFSGAGSFSYPSGHSMLAPIIWSLSLVLLARSVRHVIARRVLHLLAFLIPVLIGISRVYLGVHYPSDVLAGLLLGTAWMLLWSALPLPSSKCEP